MEKLHEFHAPRRMRDSCNLSITQKINSSETTLSSTANSYRFAITPLRNSRNHLNVHNQDPATVDPMTKMQNELDETKIILHSTIAAVLERGEKLDDLVSKSDNLSLQSKTFYKTAKKTNSCCGSWS